jgi:UDP-glucose 4-epimerase
MRDILDAHDAALAVLKVTFNGSPGQVFNIGRGQGVKIKDAVQKLVSMSTVKDITTAEIAPAATNITADPKLHGGFSSLVADVTKVGAAVAWKPTVELTDTLQNELNHWRSVIKALYTKPVEQKE